MARILVLEDDEIASMSLKRRLEVEGYEVDCFSDSLEALEACDKFTYSLLILDITIHGSDLNGLEVAARIRKKYDMPFIFVTGAASEKDSLRGYYEGAISYVVKPFSYKVLTAQIRNILSSAPRQMIVNYMNFSVDLRKNLIRFEDGQEANLSTKPIQILAHLIRNKGRVVSKKELSDVIWAEKIPVSDDVINSQIRHIRKVLGKDIITTRRGRGYEIDG